MRWGKTWRLRQKVTYHNKADYSADCFAAAEVLHIISLHQDAQCCWPFYLRSTELLKQLDSLHSYDLLNQYAMKSLTIAPDNPKAYCWLIRSLKAQGMNELATNELAAAKEHLTTEEYEEILAFGANW